MKNMKNLMRACLVFMVLFGLFILGAVLENQKIVIDQQAKLEDDLMVVKTNIENMILSRMINAKGLSGLLEITGDFNEDEYDVFAETLYDSVNHVVKDIVLITDTTISHVYPRYLGFEAIGVDLAQVDSQRDILLYTKSTGKSVFFGPVDLVEGGKGIVIRVPVFVEEAYYGQLAIVFDYYNFVEASGIKALTDQHFIRLMGMDPTSGKSDFIWYNSRELPEDRVALSIELNQIEWTIEAYPVNGWSGASALFYTILIVGFIFSGISAMIYHSQLTLKDKLLSANLDLTVTVDRLAESEKKLTSQYNEIKSKEAYIQYLADHDPLTKLYNRRMFNEKLRGFLGENHQGYVALLDLDNFKNVNDIHGHIHGDSLLRRVSQIIKEVVGHVGTAYRFGGDEFLILFDGAFEDQQIDAYMATISERCVGQSIDEVTNHVTMSTGIVTYPLDGSDVETLLIKADVAMYSAKYLGKNQRVMFNDDLLKDFDVKMDIENTIRQGLIKDGFMIYYQPIVDIHSGCVVSFEALVRLKDFKYSPMAFIPVAEESGLIIPLGNWIIEEVVRQIRLWTAMGYGPKPVAINLSSKQLVASDFLNGFFGLLKTYNIPSHLVEVEITESILLENETENIAVLNKLREAGIKISMDDFGTGYSSLNYLTYLPVDKIKLDKSLKDKFLKMDNPQVLTGIIAMAHGLALKVVAEGVEEVDEWAALKMAGCDYLQGYYFSRPVPSRDVKDLMNGHYDQGQEKN